METQLPTDNKNAENLSLQEYADLYCDGDRYRAIYVLVDSDVAGSFDRHIDDLSPDEASFVLWLVQNAAEKAYGGEAPFQKALKANTLAASLGVETDNLRPDTPNPFAKKLILSIIGVFAAIALMVAVGLINKAFDMNIAYVGEICMGLAATSTAGYLIQFFRFQKLKKLVADLPTDEELQASEYAPPPFEEAFARFQQTSDSLPAIEKDEAERLLRASSNQNVKTLLWLLVYSVAIGISISISYAAGIVAGILGALALIAFLVWQVVTMFRCLLKSKAVANVKDVDEPQQKSLDTRQSLLVLAAIVIAGLYLIMALVGCLASIMIALPR